MIIFKIAGKSRFCPHFLALIPCIIINLIKKKIWVSSFYKLYQITAMSTLKISDLFLFASQSHGT